MRFGFGTDSHWLKNTGEIFMQRFFIFYTTNAANAPVTRAVDAASCDVIVRMMTRQNVFVCAFKENNGKFLPYEKMSALAK